MDDNKITLITEDGKEELATILFTHDTNDKSYVVFELEETGNISAAIYEEDADGEGRLLDIETDEEWEMLDQILDDYFAELEEDLEEDEDEE